MMPRNAPAQPSQTTPDEVLGLTQYKNSGSSDPLPPDIDTEGSLEASGIAGTRYANYSPNLAQQSSQALSAIPVISVQRQAWR